MESIKSDGEERIKLKSASNIPKCNESIRFLEFWSNLIFQNSTQKGADLGSGVRLGNDS